LKRRTAAMRALVPAKRAIDGIVKMNADEFIERSAR